ncbi:MAG: hypothetical protein HYV07_18265 [Deltaproteobacteria bacterium]|nr:hypothetical protein [Deltaproteobacteria bacterium]
MPIWRASKTSAMALLLSACGPSPIVLPDVETGDLLAVVVKDNGSVRVDWTVMSESGWSMSADEDGEIYGWIIQRKDLVTSVGDPIPEDWALGFRARVASAPAPEGSCGRCLAGPNDSPIPVWPGTSCPIPASARGFVRNATEDADVVRERIFIDWPGVCPCAESDLSGVSQAATRLVLRPADSLWPGSWLVVTSSGGAALLGEHVAVFSDGSVHQRLSLFPDELTAAAEGPDGFLVVSPSGAGSSIASVSWNAELREIGRTEGEVEAIAYDAARRQALLGGAFRGILRDPFVQLCTFDSFRCTRLNPSGIGSGSFRSVTRSSEGAWVARDLEGSIFVVEPVTTRSMAVSTVLDRETEAGSFGHLRFQDESVARWAYLRGAAGTTLERWKAAGRTVLIWGVDEQNHHVIRSIRIGPEVFDGEVAQVRNVFDFGTDALCRGFGERGSSLIAYSDQGRSVRCVEGAEECVEEPMVAVGPGAGLTEVVSQGGAVWASTDTGLYRLGVGEAWSSVAGAAPGDSVRAVVAVPEGFWLLKDHAVGVLERSGELEREFSVDAWARVDAAAYGDGRVWVAGREPDVGCEDGRSRVFSVDLASREVDELGADLGCGGARALAWLDGSRLLAVTPTGELAWIDDDEALEISVDWDDPATELVESRPLDGLVTLSASAGVGFAGGHEGSLVRVEGWSRPRRAVGIFLGANPGNGRENTSAVAAVCPDEAWAGLRLAYRLEVGELFRAHRDSLGRLVSEPEPRNSDGFSGHTGRSSGDPSQLVRLDGRWAMVFPSSFHFVGSDWRMRLDGFDVTRAASNDTHLVLGGTRGQWMIFGVEP